MFGNLAEVRRDRLAFISKITRDFGDIVRFRMGFQVLHLINHPDHVRYVLQENHRNYRKGVGLQQARYWLGNGLVTSEGEMWSRQRSLINPAFHRQRISRFTAVVTDATTSMLDRWRISSEEGKSIDVSSQLMQLTLAVITRVMFSSEVTNSGEISAAFTTALRDAMERMTAIVILPPWLPSPGNVRLKRALGTLNHAVDTIIRNQPTNGTQGHNLLSILAASSDTQGDAFDANELREQVLTILLAGHDTTATSLSWTFYLLSRNPSAWQQVRSEVDRVLGGRLPAYEDLRLLTWTRMVYEESLRLYPPVWLIPRRAIRADEIGGYHIPAGSHVLVSPWTLHRHPAFWSNAEEFDPARFSSERMASRHPQSFLPFGAGPRACIGTSLAMMEAIVVLAMVIQRFQLRLANDSRVVPEPLLTLRFRHGLDMTPLVA